MKDPVQFLDELFFQEPNKAVHVRFIGPQRFLLVFDPAIAQDVLAQKNHHFVQNKSIFDRIRPITGNKGLVQLNGPASLEAKKKYAHVCPWQYGLNEENYPSKYARVTYWPETGG